MKTKIKKSKWGKLPKAFKNKWIKALKSGKYIQGKDRIYDVNTDTYCCLGVACDIVNCKSDSNFIIFTNSRKIPKILKGASKENKLVKKLVDMNDYSQKSFKEIAKWIEKNL